MAFRSPAPTAVLPRPAAGRWTDVLVLSWVESRPTVQVVFLLRAVVGFAASPSHLRLQALADGRAAIGFAAWVLATVGVYLVNGICDAEEDRANGVGRPIGSGRLDPAAALRVYLLVSATSLALASTLGLQFLALDVTVVLVGAAYSARPVELSRTTPGAAATVFLLGLLTYLAGARIAGGVGSAVADVPLLLVAVAMSLWMGLVGAVVKDLSDVDGDAAAGRRTLAVRHGAGAARRFACVAAPAVGGGLLVGAVVWAPVLLVPGVAASLGAVAVVVAASRPAPDSTRAARRRPYRAFMVTQYAVNLAALAVLI